MALLTLAALTVIFLTLRAVWVRRTAKQSFRDAKLGDGELVSIDTERQDLGDIPAGEHLLCAVRYFWSARSRDENGEGNGAGGAEERCGATERTA
jgi:hypothetical protein